MEGSGLIEVVTRLVFQLAIIFVGANIFSQLTERYLKQPGVIGELIFGILISPYLLGQMIHIPHVGQLFEIGNPIDKNFPLSLELYSLAQVAVVLLLFQAGLHTDLKLFFRHALSASVVAVGGVVLPFVFGVLLTKWFGYVDYYLHPEALFVGAIFTATSVGLTARILTEIKKLNTPEGVTILAAAVVDDVLGILVLTIVASIGFGEGRVSWGEIGIIGVKAIGVWLIVLILGILFSEPLLRIIGWFGKGHGLVSIVIGIAFAISALVELFGLAMIIGAYAIGLALSRTKEAEKISKTLEHVNAVFVPIFFVTVGMMVDITKTVNALGFGFVLAIFAILSKLFGCGLPALLMGFNWLGATRIGVGMVPRGEVALIIAGIGLARGVITQDIYGVAILVTVLTTIIPPGVLTYLFKIEKSPKALK